MSNAQYRVDGTPKWAVRRIVEIAVLLPLGALVVGMMASPGLLALWWYSDVAFTAGAITVLWVGSLAGTQIARGGVNDGGSEDDETPAYQPMEALMVLFALFLTVASMTSAHVIGVALLTTQLAPIVPASVVVFVPIGLSIADMSAAQTTGYSVFGIGFKFAYGVLRVIEIVIDVDKGMFAGIGEPVLDLISLPRRSIG
ncbi:hypothetical protein [Halorubrum cibi]|uniref:Uncharacterized protein n=1 Tax=Halorubrum cibi TaxID=413815 RepID=A0A521F5E1_9EURY|nr:hypothetical protein [Halorubrum cibi]SMO90760.1 hypothetical protein SAMN06264867_1183 [Halorubrum cibi]